MKKFFGKKKKETGISNSNKVKQNNNAQEWLDKYYPPNGKAHNLDTDIDEFNEGKTRKKITELRISVKNNLTGSLKLEGFVNLIRLDCFHNQLTSLDLRECGKLKRLWCHNDHLTTIIYPLEGKKLVSLNISNNNFSSQDLSGFSSMINLESLFISNNHFYGSLKPLTKLTKLTMLGVVGTKVKSDLEYLPESLNDLFCDGQLAEILVAYKNISVGYDYQTWRKDHQELIASLLEKETILNNLQLALTEQTLAETTDKALQTFLFQTEEKIKELKKRLYKKEQTEAKIEQLSINPVNTNTNFLY